MQRDIRLAQEIFQYFLAPEPHLLAKWLCEADAIQAPEPRTTTSIDGDRERRLGGGGRELRKLCLFFFCCFPLLLTVLLLLERFLLVLLLLLHVPKYGESRCEPLPRCLLHVQLLPLFFRCRQHLLPLPGRSLWRMLLQLRDLRRLQCRRHRHLLHERFFVLPESR